MQKRLIRKVISAFSVVTAIALRGVSQIPAMAWISLCFISVGAGSAKSQTATPLPEIRVTAPSPIVRRAPQQQQPTTQQPGPNDAAPADVAAAPDAPLPGTLPIVTDQFATVTVVPNEELRRSSGGTLGDVL